ncbi:VOC family protein [Lysobacter sp. LF1]|uniref:VOC family protein n=1 Tax=Lysobacter stagni TaxID=3045172 RepID=A0ABT6XDQ4_9GAMM|nr:VOC family protein [Lysobacter sp. LF1]MDI9238267.1 VOC family protein [Lysobacter sp. LF1]
MLVVGFWCAPRRRRLGTMRSSQMCACAVRGPQRARTASCAHSARHLPWRSGMNLQRSKPWSRLSALCCALILGTSTPIAIAADARQLDRQPGYTNEIDHALLWGRSIDQVSMVMAMKLGFQVRPGRNPDGVANRYVRFGDRSYLELFGIERADAELDPGMQADQSSLHGAPGARTFGLRASNLEGTLALLKAQGFAPTPVFSASPDDPDGDGPSRPPRWRLFAFERSPLSSHLFYIDYSALEATPARVVDTRVAQEQPNGAQALTGIWLLSSDADADRRQLERMGFGGATPVRLRRIAAQGYRIQVGHKELLALQPAGPGTAAEALRDGGPQVLGISIEVQDIDRAQRRVERGYDVRIPRYQGSQGDAFLAPTQEDLGLLVEFHASKSGDS